jgi:hypothetical protein
MRVWGDSTYPGQAATIRAATPAAAGFTQRRASRSKSLSPREREVDRTKAIRPPASTLGILIAALGHKYKGPTRKDGAQASLTRKASSLTQRGDETFALSRLENAVATAMESTAFCGPQRKVGACKNPHTTWVCPSRGRSSMDRASGFEPEGWGFESLRPRKI